MWSVIGGPIRGAITDVQTWLSEQWENIFGEGPDSVRTKISDLISPLTELWGGIWDTVTGPIRGPIETIKTWLTDQWNNIFGSEGEDSPLTRIQNFVTTITKAWKGLFGIGGSIRKPLTDFKDWITEQWNLIFGGVGSEGILTQINFDVLFSLFQTMFGGVTAAAGAVVGSVTDIAGGGIRGIISGFKNFIGGIFGADGSIAEFFRNFSLQNLLDVFTLMFTGDEGGPIKSLLTGLVTFATDIFKEGGLFSQAISSVADVLKAMLLTPIQNVMNGVIDVIVSGINFIIDIVNDLLSTATGAIPALSLGLLDNLDPSNYHLDFASARDGGILSGIGMVHKGEMLINAGEKTGVFPSEWVVAQNRIAAGLERLALPPQRQLQPVFVDGGGSRSQEINQNFYGQTDGQSVRRAAREMDALIR